MIEVKLNHAQSQYFCPECGWGMERAIVFPPGNKNMRHTCQPKKEPCVHLGDETRRVQCQSCGGNVQIRVFQCSVHGEASLTKDVGVRTCQGCPDYKSLESK